MNSTDFSSPTPPVEGVVAAKLFSVYIWVLVVVGLPSNLICLLTVLSMKWIPSISYVALLAVVDSLALLLKLIFHQLNAHRKLYVGTAGCRSQYIVHYSSCYANWVLTLICFERFFAVCFPLKRQVYFTKRRVYFSSVALAVALLVFFSPMFFFEDWDARRKRCTPRKDMITLFKAYRDGLYNTVYFFVPFLLVAVFITSIIVSLKRYRQVRRTICADPANSGNAATEHAISIMMLAAGLVFLVLILPACLFHMHFSKQYDLNVLEENAKHYLFYQVVTVLTDANHAVNFFIYFTSEARFRRRMMELLQRCSCLSRLRTVWRQTPADTDSSEDMGHRVSTCQRPCHCLS